GLADQSTSGTATIIHHNEGKVALLTCAHVVNYPDTVASYFYDDDGNISPYLEALLIKDVQVIYAVGFPEGSKMEIIALDKKHDLALIGRDYHELKNYVFPVFNYPSGSAKDLEWGTFVYVFGYPMNYQMITKALVSSPNRDSEGSFLLDAVVNKGYSGGIVLAIKDGVPNFELVGIVQWVPEEENNIIAPSKRKDDEPYNPLIPYEGEFFVKRDSDIKYGIAKIISIETIKNFIGKNKQALYDKGYYINNYMPE
ncbi:MAG: trypsin-like peptidase domain-containing protein, partial [Ignavibacterium sp.]